MGEKMKNTTVKKILALGVLLLFIYSIILPTVNSIKINVDANEESDLIDDSFDFILDPINLTNFNISDVATEALNISNYMEVYRKLPENISLCNLTLNTAEYLWVLSSIITCMDYDPNCIISSSNIPSIEQASNPYIEIEISESAFGKQLLKSDYLAFMNSIKDILNSTTTAPNTLNTNKGAVRYCDAVYIASTVMRYYYFFSSLPKFVDVKVISIKGLLPWETPEGFENYTTPVDSSYSIDDDSSEFCQSKLTRFYFLGATDFHMFQLAKEIAGDATDPYNASKNIWQWVKNRWAASDTTMDPMGHEFKSAFEWLKDDGHACTPVSDKYGSLFRALGIPTKLGGTWALVYFEDRGWIPAPTHGNIFGEWGGDSPGPTEGLRAVPYSEDPVFEGINTVFDESSGLDDVPSSRSFFINPSDIIETGVDKILETCLWGQYDTIVIPIKTWTGGLWYDSQLYPDRIQFDALGRLLDAIRSAHQDHIKVYISMDVLVDKISTGEHPDWKQKDWQNSDVGVTICPCVPEYRNFLKSVLSEVINNYCIDGVLLTSLYFYSKQCCFNQYCIDEFENDTGLNFWDHAHLFEDAHGQAFDYIGEQWRWQEITDYAENLTNHIKEINPMLKVIYGSERIPGGGNWLVSGDSFWMYDTLSDVCDYIMLIYHSNIWLNSYNYDSLSHLEGILDHIHNQPIVSLYLTDEWEFPPEFYLAASKLFKENGIDWINFHGASSPEGDKGAAFTSSQFCTLKHVFSDITQKYVWVDDDFDILTQGWNITHFNKIQNAINAVKEQGIIYVYNGVYHENIIINKTISLIGENRNKTIIDGNGSNVVQITVDNVNISYFTFQNSGFNATGINVTSNYNYIFASKIAGNDCSIRINDYSSNNAIIANNIIDNYLGIKIHGNCANNVLYHNNFKNNTEHAFDEGINTLWDDEYPSGGNYWDDYCGTDIDPQDGLGDILRYIQGGDNADEYPLMNPWGFLLEGYCFYENGDPVNTVNVTIDNLDTGKQWQADITDNYYRFELIPGIDINAGERLQVIAMDDTYHKNVTGCVLTDSEIQTKRITIDLILDRFDVDQEQSFITLTDTNYAGLTTCPMGDGFAYKYVKITVKNPSGDPIPGIPAEDFKFMVLTGLGITRYYGELSCTFNAVNPETNSDGEIRFEVIADTSIYGSIIINAEVGGVIIVNSNDLPCTSYDRDTENNCDGDVDLGDFNRFAVDFGYGTWTRSDYNWDGKVDLSDFSMFAVHFGHHS